MVVLPLVDLMRFCSDHEVVSFQARSFGQKLVV
jgi:hypothetical protein